MTDTWHGFRDQADDEEAERERIGNEMFVEHERKAGRLKEQVDAEYVRNWARKRGIEVGVRGHLSKSLVKYFNERHHGKFYRSNNPWEKQ